MAEMALDTATVRSAVASGRFRRELSSRFWRELYVGAPVGGTLIEGFVDLLHEGPEGYVVVDYKTGALPDGDEAVEAEIPDLAGAVSDVRGSVGGMVAG